ncbi:helix-turn-helix domain-containing protein [Rossellomorea marisflavi]|uniref:helix-turn-helix domain-containing protein n=1 Tax=Rossellomorea marisflavi TaxID=189381 RepID=UPI00345CFA19
MGDKCRIREWLKTRGMSQRDLAMVTNLSETYVSDIVRGRIFVSLHNGMTIAKALNVTIEELYTWKVRE